MLSVFILSMENSSTDTVYNIFAIFFERRVFTCFPDMLVVALILLRFSLFSDNGAPTYLMSLHELNFLKAEAYSRMNQKDNAETALKAGIETVFVKVGLTAAAAGTYYTSSVKALFDADPLKEIMTQKYIASFEQEVVEAYNDYRRLVAMGNNVIQLVNTRAFPQRLTYGDSDVTTNQNVATAYGDGNYVYTEKVWWAGGTR